MKPNFKNIDINRIPKCHSDYKMWEKENSISADWQTPEQIDVKPVYTKNDLKDLEHLDYAAGLSPFLGGPYSTM